MLDHDEIRRVLDRVRAFDTPMLSLYVQSNPARPENNPRSVSVRATNAMKHAGVPVGIVEAIRNQIDAHQLPGRTMAVFANAENVEIVATDVDLPVDDHQREEGLAHWGRPNVTPLLLALDDHRRQAIVYVDGDHWRFFETSLGQTTEVERGSREPAPLELDNDQGTSDRVPTTRADRGDAARDLHASHIADHRRRFHKDAARRVAELAEERRVEGIVVVCAHADDHHFTPELPKRWQERVVGTVSGPGSPEASAAEFYAKAAPTLAEAEAERERALLDAVRERGISGVERCLDQLQQGRMRSLVTGVRTDQTVFQAVQDGALAFVATDAQQARASFVDDGSVTVTEVPLGVLLPVLAERYGTELEIVQGDQAERLDDEFGGLAGLLR